MPEITVPEIENAERKVTDSYGRADSTKPAGENVLSPKKPILYREIIRYDANQLSIISAVTRQY